MHAVLAFFPHTMTKERDQCTLGYQVSRRAIVILLRALRRSARLKTHIRVRKKKHFTESVLLVPSEKMLVGAHAPI